MQGTRYRNKFRAIDASKGNVKDISFTTFKNDPSFSEFAWSIEPQTPLNELMKTRAQQLRIIILILSCGTVVVMTLPLY